MLCQTIHVWITYIQPTVTYIFCCYARPCLELITSNLYWRMSSLSHSSPVLVFEKQTLSVSQTFVWCTSSILYLCLWKADSVCQSDLCLAPLQVCFWKADSVCKSDLCLALLQHLGTQFVGFWADCIFTGLLHKSSRSWSESISNYLLAIFTLLGVSFSFLPNLGVCLSRLIF